MKISEVLERIKEISLPDTAKELGLGRDRLQRFLSEIGCRHKRGTKEWLYEGEDTAILDEDIYSHVPKKGERNSEPKQETQKSNKKVNTETKESNETNNQVIKQDGKQSIQETSKTVKKVTYEIDENLHFELRMEAFKQKKNVSELVEKAFRDFLEKK